MDFKPRPPGSSLPNSSPLEGIEGLESHVATLEALLASTDSYIYAKDLQGRYVYVNPRVCELFALPADQVIGRDDSEFFDQAHSLDLRNDDHFVLSQDGVWCGKSGSPCAPPVSCASSSA